MSKFKRARLACLVLILTAAGTVNLTARPATASVNAATPSQRACTAFAAWDRHRRTADLDAMLTTSELAPWKYLGSDAVVLYTDVRAHESTASDIRWLRADCPGA